MLQRLVRDYRGIVLPLTFFLFSIGAVMYGLVPGGRKVFDGINKRQQLKSQVQQLRKKVSILASLDEETLRQQFLALAAAVPPDKAIPSVFSTVERLSAETGIQLGDVTVMSPGSLATESAQKQTVEEKKMGSNMLTFTVLLEGTPKQVHDFFDAAVRVRRSLRVRLFDFTVLSADRVTVRAAMNAFYAPLPTTLGDIATPVESLNQQEEAIVQRVLSSPLYSQGVSVQESVDGQEASTAVPSTRDPFGY